MVVYKVKWGIRDHPTAPRSPWQNGYIERLIGSTRREALDHLILFDEAQLRRVLRNYAAYYNIAARVDAAAELPDGTVFTSFLASLDGGDY